MYDKNWVIALAAAEIAVEGQDFIYKYDERAVHEDGTLGAAACSYYEEDGTPSCLVGRILHNAGLIDPDTFTREGASAGQLVDSLGGFTPEARATLNRLQSYQDEGYTWGEALAYANEEYP